jgi:HSP20 family protein
MAFDLIPSSFLTFPSFRFPSLWEEEEEEKYLSLPNIPSGLTVSEDDKKVYIEAAVPGVDPDKIEVTFNKGVLWIKAEGEEEEKGKKYYRKASRSFSYRVAVPGNIDEKAEPEAVCKNGIMKVTFAKTPEAKPKKITVKKG